MPDRATWLARVESLRPVVEAHAAEADRIRRLPLPVVDGIVANRLFRPWIPRDYDGEELDLLDSLAVFEAASAIDGAFGWAVTIGVGGALFAPLFEPSVARSIYEPADAVIAGSGSPGGVLRPEPGGGYRASGRWSYASGAHHATCITTSCRVLTSEGSPALDESGQPRLLAIAVSPSEVAIDETWDTLGMRGTGSHDIVVEDVFVPAERTFQPLSAPKLPGPLYRFPFVSIAEASFAAVALGCGRHFVEEFAALAASKPRRAGGVLGEQPGVSEQIGESRIAVHAAREGFLAAVRDEWEAVLEAGVASEEQMAATRRASVFAARTAVEASDRLYGLAGMSVLPMGGSLGRAWRDLHTVSQHVLLSPLGYR